MAEFKPGDRVTFYFSDGTELPARVLDPSVGTRGHGSMPDFVTADGHRIFCVDEVKGLFAFGESGDFLTLTPPE